MKKRLGLLIGIILLGLAGCGQKQETEGDQEAVYEGSEAEAVETEYNEEELLADLQKNLEIMAKDPKDTDARLEVIRSQIGLKNYDVALVNLSMLMSINPKIPEIYDLYIQISKEQNNISLATSTISKANLYDVQEFLSKVPEEPVFSVESGYYEDKVSLEITSNDPEAEIYYRCYGNVVNHDTIQYTGPVDIMTGEVRVWAYTLKDGVPSNTVEMTYNVNYSGTPVVFEDSIVEQAVREGINSNLGYMPDTITDIDCWNLTYLNIQSERQKIRLDDLKWMPNLQSINLYNSEYVVDYSPLQYCKNISYLYLPYGNLTNLDFVAYMPNLTILYVGDNQISDVSALKECKKIEQLEISRNPVTGLEEAIAGKSIKYLTVSDYQIADYSVLTELESLNIRGFDFNTAQIAKLTGLTNLSIEIEWDEVWDYSNLPVLSDISFVQNMVNLEYLHLAGISDAEQLQYLYGLQNLKNLYIYNSDVTENKIAMESLQAALPNCQVRY